MPKEFIDLLGLRHDCTLFTLRLYCVRAYNTACKRPFI